MPTNPEERPQSKSAGTASADRREHKRLPARSTVMIEIRNGSMFMGPNLAVNLIDLSVEGARVLMSGKLVVGDEVEILLSGHGIRSKVKRLAKVRWLTKLVPDHFVMGFQFDKPISNADLNSFVRPDSTEMRSPL